MSSSSPVEQQNITSTSELINAMSGPAFATPCGDATTEALGIDELLLLIIEAVPKHDLSKLRRVSKKWNEIISSVGYAIKPSFFDASKLYPYTITEDILYHLDVAMSINPAINASAELSTWPCDVNVALESVIDPAKLLSRRQEFITSPPITTVNLAIRGRLDDVMEFGFYAKTAILRDNTGIRIGLMLDMFNKMRDQALQPLQHAAKIPWGHAYLPVAYLRYSGVEVVTHLEEGYVEHTFGLKARAGDRASTGSTGRDCENHNSGREENKTGDEERTFAEGRRRSVLRCPNLRR
jgi:hypothetical protein